MKQTEVNTSSIVNREILGPGAFWPLALLFLIAGVILSVHLYRPDSYTYLVPNGFAAAAATTMINRLLTRLARPFKEPLRRDGVLLLNATLGLSWLIYAQAVWPACFIFGSLEQAAPICGIFLFFIAFLTVIRARRIADPVDLAHIAQALAMAILVLGPAYFLDHTTALKIEIYLAATFPVIGVFGLIVSIPVDKARSRTPGPWEIAKHQDNVPRRKVS